MKKALRTNAKYRYMKRLAILSLGLLLAAPSFALGQEQTLTRQIAGKPDSDINAGIFVTTRDDCTIAPPPSVEVVTPPAHGKVTLAQGKVDVPNYKQCPAAQLPAFFATYRSQPDYVGNDEFAIEIVTAGGKKQIQKITIALTKAGT